MLFDGTTPETIIKNMIAHADVMMRDAGQGNAGDSNWDARPANAIATRTSRETRRTEKPNLVPL
jgi:hypothetical protein